MRVKTAPRVLIGVLILGAIGYGLNTWIEKRPKPIVQPQEVVQSQPLQQEPAQSQPEPIQQPVAPMAQPNPTRPSQSDSALNSLINQGKK